MRRHRSYAGPNGHSQAFIETLSGGNWTAVWAPLPAGAAPSSATATAGAYLNSVTCPAPVRASRSGCTQSGSGIYCGLVRHAVGRNLDGGDSTSAGRRVGRRPSAGLSGISCQTPGNCVAIGYYIGRGGSPGSWPRRCSAGTLDRGSTPAARRCPRAHKTNVASPSSLRIACQEVGSLRGRGVILKPAAGRSTGRSTRCRAGHGPRRTAPLPPGAATTAVPPHLAGRLPGAWLLHRHRQYHPELRKTAYAKPSSRQPSASTGRRYRQRPRRTHGVIHLP